MNLLDDPMRMQEQIAALPEPLAYIVLDHSMRRGDKVTERDGHGRKYLRVPPSVMDALLHQKARDTTPGVLTASLTGVSVYRREDMPEGWPYDGPLDDQHGAGQGGEQGP